MSPKVLVLKKANAKVYIYWGEFHGPHCHVLAPEGEVSFDLENFDVLASRGFSQKALNQIQKELRFFKQFLKEKWDEIQEESKN